LQKLYREGVCGGVVLGLAKGGTLQAEVPMAFQSALAGILMAADMIAGAARLRKTLPTRTQINLLTALALTPSSGQAATRAASVATTISFAPTAPSTLPPRTENGNRHHKHANWVRATTLASLEQAPLQKRLIPLLRWPKRTLREIPAWPKAAA
jgi:hypothetical protein